MNNMFAVAFIQFVTNRFNAFSLLPLAKRHAPRSHSSTILASFLRHVARTFISQLAYWLTTVYAMKQAAAID